MNEETYSTFKNTMISIKCKFFVIFTFISINKGLLSISIRGLFGIYTNYTQSRYTVEIRLVLESYKTLTSILNGDHPNPRFVMTLRIQRYKKTGLQPKTFVPRERERRTVRSTVEIPDDPSRETKGSQKGLRKIRSFRRKEVFTKSIQRES